MATIIWEVTAPMWEEIAALGEQLTNMEIGEQDYIDKLRAYGMPPSAPGDHVRIVHRVSRTFSHPTLARLNGGVLPGLPN